VNGVPSEARVTGSIGEQRVLDHLRSRLPRSVPDRRRTEDGHDESRQRQYE
jgi:hypothetical protein